MEGNPRTVDVNSRVREMLEGDKALGHGLRDLDHKMRDIRSIKKCRLHEKLYYFSHPTPNVLVGTFNPSGNTPEDPEILSEIGDQDRGHNVLAEIRDPVLVRGLHKHAQNLFSSTHGPWECLLPRLNRVLVSGKTRILFFPRVRWRDFNGLFDRLDPKSRLRIAVSHLNDPKVCKKLFSLARQGARVEVLAHDTERRVPAWVEEQMRENGIIFNRYVHPEGLPMHNKFMLFETPGRKTLAFGSMNLSIRSLRANHELLVVTEEPELYKSMEQRWQLMMQEIQQWGKTS